MFDLSDDGSLQAILSTQSNISSNSLNFDVLFDALDAAEADSLSNNSTDHFNLWNINDSETDITTATGIISHAVLFCTEFDIFIIYAK